MSLGWSWGSGKESWANRAPLVLAVLAVAGTTALVMCYAGQPLLDRHAFRQTQTAITSYWFIREGYKLACETPIAGYPWLLPFEFPLYQAVVAAVSQITGWPLGMVGRLVSYMFLLSCIPVASAIPLEPAIPGVRHFRGAHIHVACLRLLGPGFPDRDM